MNANSRYKQRAAKQAKAEQPKPTLGYVKLIQAALGPDYMLASEVRFHPTRKWRFDLLIHRTTGDLSRQLAVEVEGGSWVAGRHTRGKGFESDLEKYYEAMRLGWRVLRVTPGMLMDGRAVQWIKELLK